MEKETYHITVEVKTIYGKLKDIIKFHLDIYEHQEGKYVLLEHSMRTIHASLKKLNVEYDYDFDASVFNSISSTYMSMAGFYSSENKFVKFT